MGKFTNSHCLLPGQRVLCLHQHDPHRLRKPHHHPQRSSSGHQARALDAGLQVCDHRLTDTGGWIKGLINSPEVTVAALLPRQAGRFPTELLTKLFKVQLDELLCIEFANLMDASPCTGPSL